MYAVTRSFANSVAQARRWRRTPTRATGVRRRDSSSSASSYYTSRDGCAVAAPCSRRSSRPASARSPAAAAYGFLYDRHAARGHPRDVPRPRTAARARRAAHRSAHRHPSQPLGLARGCGARGRALMNEHPDLIVLGGDYVTWGDRRVRRPVAEALAPLSAPHGVFAILGNHDDDHDMPAALGENGVQVLKDARTRLTIRDETARSRRASASGRSAQIDIADPDPRRRTGDRAARARSATADRSRRARTFRWCCQATRTADRSCCRSSAPSPRRSFRWSPAWAAGSDDDVREPRGGNGLRSGPGELSAGGRRSDAAPA